MTTVSEAVKTGNGKILGVFRTVPAPARAVVEEKTGMLKEAGINAVYALGNTSEPVCQILSDYSTPASKTEQHIEPRSSLINGGNHSQEVAMQS